MPLFTVAALGRLPSAALYSRALTPVAPSGFAEIWVNSDLQPIGQPTGVGSAIVGLTARDRLVFLIGSTRRVAMCAGQSA